MNTVLVDILEENPKIIQFRLEKSKNWTKTRFFDHQKQLSKCKNPVLLTQWCQYLLASNLRPSKQFIVQKNSLMDKRWPRRWLAKKRVLQSLNLLFWKDFISVQFIRGEILQNGRRGFKTSRFYIFTDLFGPKIVISTCEHLHGSLPRKKGALTSFWRNLQSWVHDISTLDSNKFFWQNKNLFNFYAF